MCGRFTLITEIELLVRRYNVRQAISFDYLPRYNIAPTQPVIAIISNGEEYRMGLLNWGLIPSWTKEKKPASKLINARAETVSEKPSFKNLLLRRRCLIPADSFYEWKKDGDSKIPIRITLKERQLFAMAGLWDSWRSPEGEIIYTCTIITTEANQLVQPVHHRMPVILSQEAEAIWLNPAVTDANLLKSLLTPYPDDLMDIYQVSVLVNSPKNDGPECIV